MQENNKDEAAALSMGHLECLVLDFFHNAFAEHAHFNEEGRDYQKVKEALVDMSGGKSARKIALEVHRKQNWTNKSCWIRWIR